MLTLAISFLILSFAYALYVFRVKQMYLASNYVVFILFSLMYSVFPALTVLGIEPKVWFVHWSLNESFSLVSAHIAITASCVLVWAYAFHKRQHPLSSGADATAPAHKGAGAVIVFLLYMAMCVVLIVLGAKYSYASGGLSEMGLSGMSKAKVFLASIYIMYMVRYGTGRRLAIMFLAFVVLLLIEHSRWYFVSVLFATGFYLQNRGRVTNRQIAIVALVFLLLLCYVGLYRSSVPLTSLGLLFSPMYIEGDYGSYMVLQTYHLLFSGNMSYCTMFADYFVDPFLYMLPRTLFLSENVDKEAVGLFPAFIAEHQQYLDEKYAPLGGFFYTAQASSALPFVGPLFITFLFAVITISVENKRNRSGWWQLIYYLYSAGFVFVFIKTRFDTTINYYLTLSVPAYILYYIVTNPRFGLSRDSAR